MCSTFLGMFYYEKKINKIFLNEFVGMKCLKARKRVT